ncbi:MAG TPA: hypothetical protein VFK27_03230, partial [Bacillales bacterium]|nr:hypothetical protein [Bacillales bacterium]
GSLNSQIKSLSDPYTGKVYKGMEARHQQLSQERDDLNKRVQAMVSPREGAIEDDPVKIRIEELRKEYSDEEIAGFLSEKGLDPKEYGLPDA